MRLSPNVIRVPVKLVDGVWELFYGGAVRVKDGAVGELRLERMYFTDEEFLKALTERRQVRVLLQGTELRVAVTIKPGIDKRLSQILLARDVTRHNHTAKISVDARFVSIALGGPTDLQRKRGIENGGLWLWLEGAEPRSIESGTVKLPDAAGLITVDSLNHAFTRLSEAFEPWRKAHTGSIYERMFYLEGDGIWYPLKDLRKRELVRAERQIIRRLWATVADELKMSLF
jgi:hypothetical protein